MRRKPLPTENETTVLTRSRRRCCICYGLNNDSSVKKGQIAHLDHNNSNNLIGNLAFLCFDHHDEYDSKTSQSKKITLRELKHYRSLLYQFLIAEIEKEEPSRLKWMLVLSGTVENVDKKRAEIICSHLRQISGDMHLTIERIEQGSVRLLIESSEDGFELIKSLYNSGHLDEVAELTVLSVSKDISKPINLTRSYEIAIVSKPDIDRVALSQIISKLSQIVNKHGGQVVNLIFDGVKNLAYPIEEYTKGNYTYLIVQCSSSGATAIAEIERILRVNDSVIRYLTVRTDEDLRRAGRLKAKPKREKAGSAENKSLISRVMWDEIWADDAK